MAQAHHVNAAAAPDMPAPLLPQHIPREMLNLIPEFNGDPKLLHLFYRKCEYIIGRYQGSPEVNEYLIQFVTSRLTGKAAALISERADFISYNELKDILTQHFGDPRNEECVAIELESLKKNSGESYQNFCCRIQDVRSILMSKVNQTAAPIQLKEAKRIIYNNTSLNVFLYNLSQHMVDYVRMKNPSNLEEALAYVMEEENFREQYRLKSQLLHNPKPKFDNNNAFSSQNVFGNKLPFINNKPFVGIPQNLNKFRPQQGQFNNRPPFGFRPQFGQPGFRPNPTQPAFRPQFGQAGFRQNPGQLGFRPTPGQFGYRPPTQFGHRPPTQFGFRPQAGQFGYKPPQHQGFQRPYSNEASMRTAPARPQQFPINELYTDDYEEYDGVMYELEEAYGDPYYPVAYDEYAPEPVYPYSPYDMCEYYPTSYDELEYSRDTTSGSSGNNVNISKENKEEASQNFHKTAPPIKLK